MKLAAVSDGLCAVCLFYGARVAPSAHARCAICEGSNQLVRVCGHCRRWMRKKKVGVEWNARRFEGMDLDDDSDDAQIERVEVAAPRTIARPLRDAMKPTRNRGRPRSKQIDERVIPMLRRSGRRVAVLAERTDERGRRRGTYVRLEWLSRREIARIAGCNHRAVNMRHRDYPGGKRRISRARPARAITKNME